MSYIPLTKQYRPQKFADVIGQEATVATLLEAIRSGRLGYAYLFSGGRGTGKTTLARLLAKALGCSNRGNSAEPCGKCPSCLEMSAGSSLDLLEIDGASHRSIDDIRQIRETVGYAPASGEYKIYLIDEVHMLTKEAFNALLKTLEEPPAHVKFLFATTEPHKLPATVVSRCHHFPLRRIAPLEITTKLRTILSELSIDAEEEALLQIAQVAGGSLRDAESLLDQVISFHGDRVTAEAVSEILGTTSQELFFRLDEALAEEKLEEAFSLVEELFSGGRNIGYFVDRLIAHVRCHLIAHLGTETSEMRQLPKEWREQYRKGCKLLSRDQWMLLLDELAEQRSQLATAPSQRIALEVILLRVIRARHHIPITQLVKRLVELEKGIQHTPVAQAPVTQAPVTQAPVAQAPPPPKKIPLSEVARPKTEPVKKAAPAKAAPAKVAPAKAAPASDPRKQCRYDTMMQFAAVELEGSVKK